LKNASKYKIHRTLAIIAVPLLLLSTASGFLRANQKWFWEDGYKKKKEPARFAMEQDLASLPVIVQKIDSITGQKNQFEEITLRSESGMPYYLLSTASRKKYLADAQSGEIVSPINSELASQFAMQYVKEKSGIKSCELLAAYKPRKAKEAKPAYKVLFDNSVHSEIYLDQMTGEILEEIDDNRTFGLFVMRLHDYDYFNSKREISSAVGISILLVALSGLWIYRIRLSRSRSPKD
jgi:Peptidase propeptide and YPEB domain